MPSANYPKAAGPHGETSGAPKPGEDEHRPEEPITPILVLPDPPQSGRPRFRRRLAAGAVSLLVLAGASLLLTGKLENFKTFRRAASGELEAGGQPNVEVGATATGGGTAGWSPKAPAPSSEPATGQRLRGGAEKPAVIVDDLALARREVAQEVMAFDRRRAEFESGAAGCRELAGAYGTLDRAFVRFSTLLVQAGRPPSEADGRLFEIVDQESAVFDRSSCPRPP